MKNIFDSKDTSREYNILIILPINILSILFIIVCFYIIILLYFNFLIKEEDKSFKNIVLQIRRFLNNVATQIFFLGISILFGLLSSLPLVYMAKSGGRIFAFVVSILILSVLLFFYLRRIIRVFLKEHRFSSAFAALFPGWFKFIFWILFTVYFLPLTIGMGRINLPLGIIVFLLSVIIINVIFHLDRLVNFFSKKWRTASEK